MIVKYQSNSKGFSLIEMAIALAIVGFLAGSLIEPMSVAMDYNKIKNTDTTLEQVKEALVAFAIINNRLPCPAKCYKYSGKGGDCFDGIYNSAYVGKEVSNTNPFCKQEGYLPWADLGVGRYDAWDEPFYYRVDKEYSKKITANTSLETDSSKKLTIKDKQTDKNLTANEDSGHSRVVAIILSYGKNREAESSNKITVANDATYKKGNYTTLDEDDPNYFDDRLTWISKYTLTSYLAKTRGLPQ